VLNGFTNEGGAGVPNNLWTLLSSPEAMTRFDVEVLKDGGERFPAR
jgi:hypothetical protein